MESASMKIRGRTRAGLGWLLGHDNQILGLVMLPIALDTWRNLAVRAEDYGLYMSHGIYVVPIISLLAIAFSALYLTAVTAILLCARQPLARYQTLLPNLMAVLGAFGLYLLVFFKPSETRLVSIFVPLVLLAAGAGLVLFSLFYLRRAFSVTPQARYLKRAGPYNIIRHPMYLGNILTLWGLGLVLGTPEALFLSLVTSALQVCRAHYEERLLLNAFPEYKEYMQQVGAFAPRFKSSGFRLAMLLVLSIALVHAPHVAMAQSGTPSEKQCNAWHAKAIAGKGFSQREVNNYNQTYFDADTVPGGPNCKAFFALEQKCMRLLTIGIRWPGMANSDEQNETKNIRSAQGELVELLKAQQSVPGCKSIVGLQAPCAYVKALAKVSKDLPPPVRSFLGECLNAQVVNSYVGFLRPAQ
jgi:protein-S-isoprenylcysteine O-methyltransferase Ste14